MIEFYVDWGMVDLVEFDAGDIANTSNVANILLAFDMPSYMHPPLMLEFVLAMPTFKTSVFIPQIGAVVCICLSNRDYRTSCILFALFGL